MAEVSHGSSSGVTVDWLLFVRLGWELVLQKHRWN